MFMCVCRPFELVLEPDRDLFHPNFTLLHDDTVIDQHHTKSYMYTGTEAGQEMGGDWDAWGGLEGGWGIKLLSNLKGAWY